MMPLLAAETEEEEEEQKSERKKRGRGRGARSIANNSKNFKECCPCCPAIGSSSPLPAVTGTNDFARRKAKSSLYDARVVEKKEEEQEVEE